ncbi:hypothetical protein [Bacillus sp. Marseille-Q1617]|uniref:hypothetical protein n=1 Tax=Bacillus sp. Marseille-Q1617 TaxID=2736887 RepID=UPI00158AD8CB|nr:hypothetical protein [Bacillus sp. Marseille-Q1617]
MSGIFFIILVPFLITFIAILVTNSSKETYTGGGGQTTYYGGDTGSSDHCSGVDGGFSAGDGGCGGGGE